MLRSPFSRARARQLRLLANLVLLLAAVLSSAASPGLAAAAPPSDAPTPSSSAPASSGSTTINFRDLQPVPLPGPIFFRWVFVPNCAGVTQLACENMLASSGLQGGTLSYLVPTTPPPYIGSVVVAQSPSPGTIVLRGSSVDLTLQPVSRLGPP